MKFRYRSKDKIIFYIGYFVYKIFFIWVEVKKPKLHMKLFMTTSLLFARYLNTSSITQKAKSVNGRSI